MHALSFHAGPRALARIRAHGLRAADIAVVPAAAGGPKGLIFQALDQFIFGEWLAASARPRDLIGASIGAWRMAAACQPDPVAAFATLGQLYVEQTYTSTKPPQEEVVRVVRGIVDGLIAGQQDAQLAHPQHLLHVLAARGKGVLHTASAGRGELAGFALAALRNLGARAKLAQSLERVVFSSAQADWLGTPFDAFTTHVVALTRANLGAALLSSGTLPLWMAPVRDIPGAPQGPYWDGGMIDYQLALPYTRLCTQSDPSHDDALVLYPHFNEHILPGWLDKALPWRRAARGPHADWLANLLIIAPTPAFLQTLPLCKLPDRQDFQHYGMDQAARMTAWRTAIAEGGRLRDELADFIARPDLSRLQAI